jgi:TRAP-type C4-dicarboxylate transport system substrate-binding protein
VIPAPYSATTYALFEALGALGTDLVGDAFAEGIADGSVAGVPSRRSPGLPGDQLTVATGNVTPFPNINTLVVNGDLFDALSGDQPTVHEAAVRTLDAILAGMVGELAAAEEFCAAGGGIVLAGDDELAALDAAAQPVLEELMRDDATATLIEWIDEIRRVLRRPRRSLRASVPPANWRRRRRRTPPAGRRRFRAAPT